MFVENNNLTSDTQAGFKKNYSCLDQMYVLHCLAKSRVLSKKSLFCTFIDLQKFFDWVDRDLLFYKLLKHGISGRFYLAVKSIYTDTRCTVLVNELLSSEFTVNSGLMQGETFSPQLASFYLEDLTKEIAKESVSGFDGIPINILLYADDIVLLSDSEVNMQRLLNVFSNWCKRWQITCNSEKSKVIHFRPANTPLTNFPFMLDQTILELVPEYKYLGLVFNEHLWYENATDILSKSGSRALYSLFSKVKDNWDLGFDVFTKLYDSCVRPIIEYGSAIWGHDLYYNIENVCKKAIRFYLGMPRRTPIPFLYGESGWVPPYLNNFVNKARLYNRLIKMPNSRIHKQVFLYDLINGGDLWYNDFVKCCTLIGFQIPDNVENIIDLKSFSETCRTYHVNSWKDDCAKMSKLFLYRNVKDTYGTPDYL